jgi:predicted aspartyl protease
MAITFQFKEYNSGIFGKIKRPVAQVQFQHHEDQSWQPIEMLVDTGADYTLLPQFLAPILGISLTQDCKSIHTEGVGGQSKVYLLKNKIKVKIDNTTREAPVGFLENDSVPPLLGRQEFFETFKAVFEKFTTTFE